MSDSESKSISSKDKTHSRSKSRSKARSRSSSRSKSRSKARSRSSSRSNSPPKGPAGKLPEKSNAYVPPHLRKGYKRRATVKSSVKRNDFNSKKCGNLFREIWRNDDIDSKTNFKLRRSTTGDISKIDFKGTTVINYLMYQYIEDIHIHHFPNFKYGIRIIFKHHGYPGGLEFGFNIHENGKLSYYIKGRNQSENEYGSRGKSMGIGRPSMRNLMGFLYNLNLNIPKDDLSIILQLFEDLTTWVYQINNISKRKNGFKGEGKKTRKRNKHSKTKKLRKGKTSKFFKTRKH